MKRLVAVAAAALLSGAFVPSNGAGDIKKAMLYSDGKYVGEELFVGRPRTLAQLFFPPPINGGCPAGITTFTITATTTFTVPICWNSSVNTLHAVAAGGSGAAAGATNFAGPGAGGGWAKATNVTLTPGGSIGVVIGTGGIAVSTAGTGLSGNAGTDTFLCNATTNCATIGGTAVKVGAKGGAGGNFGLPPATASGGAATAAVGGAGGGTLNPGATFAKSGGNGLSFSGGQPGGGGAAGPNGDGNVGVAGSSPSGGAGGQGDNASGGTGGAGANGTAGNGNPGTEIGSSLGSGGGGGGAGAGGGSQTGGNGGLYGAGGGGGSGGGSTTSTGGTGAGGLVVGTFTN